MLFRRKKFPPRNESVPQEDAAERWRLNFGLAPGIARARWVRKPVAPDDDPATVKDEASAEG